MPSPPVTIGEEFEAMSVANGDGGSLTIFVTVLDGTPTAPGSFTARGVQTGPSSGTLVVLRADGSVLRSINCNPGSRALVNLTGGVNINVDWVLVRGRVYLQGAAR
jgi:hypothetical protein